LLCASALEILRRGYRHEGVSHLPSLRGQNDKVGNERQTQNSFRYGRGGEQRARVYRSFARRLLLWAFAATKHGAAFFARSPRTRGASHVQQTHINIDAEG